MVTNGTGTKADVSGYDVGGKTGTAEKAENGSYAHHQLISSFCGVFPIDDPQFLVFLMLDEPHGNRRVAAFLPVARRLLLRWAASLTGLRRCWVWPAGIPMSRQIPDFFTLGPHSTASLGD